MARYRWPTVIVAATCLVLSAFCLWWVFLAYADYRSPDFTKASAGPIVGTCVESVTDDQLKAAWYDKTDWKCNDNSKEELSNLLAVSVHAMYDYHTNTMQYTGDSLAVYEAVVSATQGVDTGYMITREHAYATLSVLGAPSSTDCSTVYGVSTEGVLPVSVAPIVACDADVANSGSGDATVTPEAASVNKLYTHCAHQFSYARSYPTKGTFGIPMVGKEAKPVIIPIIATNSTTPWEDRARIIVGTRWGYATIFYVVAMLCTAFFIMDCTVLLLAELTRVDAYFGENALYSNNDSTSRLANATNANIVTPPVIPAQNAITEGNKQAMREGMMTMLATFQAKRSFRWAIAIILIILEVVLWVLLIGLPWGWGLEFKRPVCEADGAEHWLAPFHATTKGGWKLDYDAFCLEVIVVASHLFCLLVIPISELAQRGGGGGEGGRRERTGQGDLEGFTGVAVGSLRSAWWFALLAVGGLVFYIGQAVSLFRFGVAWAEGVSMNKHNEVAVGTMLYDHVNAVLYMSLTIGLALGSIIGRWLLAGLSCTSFTIFLIWVLLTVGAFIPPFFVSTYWVFFSFEDSQGQKDCKAIFGDTDFLFARTACDIQAGTYIAAIILILLASLGPVIIGLWDYSRVVCLPRRRAWVDMPDYWRKLVEPANPKFRTFAPAPGPGGSAVQPLMMNSVTGTKATTTDFFQFKTRLTVPAEDVSRA